MLADMAVGVETSRLAWWRSAWEVDQGRRNSYYASIAKCLAADVANKCATDAVQVSDSSNYNNPHQPIAMIVANMADIFCGLVGICHLKITDTCNFF